MREGRVYPRYVLRGMVYSKSTGQGETMFHLFDYKGVLLPRKGEECGVIG